MKDGRVEWQMDIRVKSTCGDVDDPPSKIRYQVSGSWNPDKRSAAEVIAVDLAEALKVVSLVLVPSSRKEISKAFVEAMKEGEKFLL